MANYFCTRTHQHGDLEIFSGLSVLRICVGVGYNGEYAFVSCWNVWVHDVLMSNKHFVGRVEVYLVSKANVQTFLMCTRT